MANNRASIFSGKQLSGTIVGIVLVAGVLAGVWQWLHGTSLDPQAVFWGTIQNDLATNGITVGQASAGTDTSTTQLNQFDFGPNKRAKSVTTFTQNGAEVQTVELSTAAADFTKYVAIKTGSAHVSGKLNLSNVVNVWANTTGTTPSKDTGVPSTFPSVLLTLATPFGDFSPSDQAGFMDEIKTGQVYTPAFSSVQKQHVGGRLRYIYSVSMQPVTFVQLMKNYAHALGMHELDAVDPNSYETSGVTTMQWTIDARSRQLVQISYDGHTELYSGYGLRITDQTPTRAIPGGELQQRVNALTSQLHD